MTKETNDDAKVYVRNVDTVNGGYILKRLMIGQDYQATQFKRILGLLEYRASNGVRVALL